MSYGRTIDLDLFAGVAEAVGASRIEADYYLPNDTQCPAMFFHEITAAGLIALGANLVELMPDDKEGFDAAQDAEVVRDGACTVVVFPHCDLTAEVDFNGPESKPGWVPEVIVGDGSDGDVVDQEFGRATLVIVSDPHVPPPDVDYALSLSLEGHTEGDV